MLVGSKGIVCGRSVQCMTIKLRAEPDEVSGSFRFTGTLVGTPNVTIETSREDELIDWLRLHHVNDAEILVQQLKDWFSVDVLEHG